MALRSGYSYNTVAGNINALEREGTQRETAIAKAYNAARKAYFRRFPAGALPLWLAHPKTHRVAQYYAPNGAPIKRSILTNPARETLNHSTKEIGAALRRYKGFTGRKPGPLVKLRIPAPFKIGVAFGTLVEVVYISERDGLHYRHTFRPKSRPLVVASSDGKQVQIVGGRFAFTDRGIVDK